MTNQGKLIHLQSQGALRQTHWLNFSYVFCMQAEGAAIAAAVFASVSQGRASSRQGQGHRSWGKGCRPKRSPAGPGCGLRKPKKRTFPDAEP